MDIINALDELAEEQESHDLLRQERDGKCNEIMSQIQGQLDALDAEYQPRMIAANTHISELTEQIKAAVIEFGRSFKATKLHAVYAKGRVTWDGKKLDGMMSIIPALADARREGEPSVTIRTVK
jgi:hypothetical protein